LIQALRLLKFTEQNQALHGNIKPSRIYIQDGKHLKMSFFGLAKLCNQRHLRQDEVSFLSPKLKENVEVEFKQNFCTKDDVYSLGKVLGKLILTKMDEEPI